MRTNKPLPKTVSIVIGKDGNILGVAGLDPEVRVAIVDYFSPTEEDDLPDTVWDGVEDCEEGEESNVMIEESTNLSDHPQLKGMGKFAAEHLNNGRIYFGRCVFFGYIQAHVLRKRYAYCIFERYVSMPNYDRYSMLDNRS